MRRLVWVIAMKVGLPFWLSGQSVGLMSQRSWVRIPEGVLSRFFIVAAKALCVVEGRGLWDARFYQIPFGILSMLHVRGTLSRQRDGRVEPVGFTMAKYPVAAFLAW